MPRRHDLLFTRIANFQALHAAARRAIKGKRKKPSAAAFFANLERELVLPHVSRPFESNASRLPPSTRWLSLQRLIDTALCCSPLARRSCSFARIAAPRDAILFDSG